MMHCEFRYKKIKESIIPCNNLDTRRETVKVNGNIGFQGKL